MQMQHVRGDAVMGVSLALIAGAAAVTYTMHLKRLRRERRAFRPVRDAGPEAMTNPPADWDCVDQAIDESFPASDPPNASRFT
jgi:hypothetical protein